MRRSLTLLCLLSMPLLAAGHGSDKPGPHNGSVRMPGAFHVEVVHEDDSLHVYLLDIRITDPIVADSSVIATVQQGGNVTELDCATDHDLNRFSCSLPGAIDLNAGTMTITAKRGDAPQATARYVLPLD